MAPRTCPDCKGYGAHLTAGANGNPYDPDETPCSRCQGTGGLS